MNTNFFRNIALVASIALTVSACGGGGDTTASGGTGGTGISFGTVTDFGSIIVNGGRLDDSMASVMMDDNPGAGMHGGLKKGMVVKVSGTFSGNMGTAASIEFRDNLEGPVCDQSTLNGITTLRVLGQTVILDATTIVDNNATINVGDIVEVSGLPDAQEVIHASFIEKKTPLTAVIEVKGRIDAVNAPTFTINNLEVNFAIATFDNSIPGGQPVVGQFVEVKGTVFACNNPAGTDTLTATRVELEPEGAGAIAAGDRAEIEGFITTALNPPGGPGAFMIGNQQIVTNGSTRFLPEDFGATDLVVGAKVEAEGTLANGVLTATKISFRQNVKLESTVANVSGTSPNFSFTLVGLPGITITTNSATEGVAPAGHVRVRGIEGPNNTVLATRIDDRTGSTDVFLQGVVDAAADPSITVLGVLVNTNAITQFQDVSDSTISRPTFFGLVQPGTLVKIKGNLVGATPNWSEAELED